MIFIIGGNSQGKLQFVMDYYSLSEDQVTDGENCILSEAFNKPLLDKLHILIKRLITAGIEPSDFVMKGIDENPRITIICDELGCGVIPLDKGERAFREVVGRIQCEIAKQADKVFRVYCGIPTLIKGCD